MNRLIRLLAIRLKRLRWISPLLRRFRIVRAWGNQFIDLPVRQLRAAVRTLRKGPVDILYLGDSTQLFVAPYDTDKRRLSELIDAELGEGVTAVRIIGPGYGPEVYAEPVRLLSALEQRPTVVVVSMAVRTTAVHITRHPEYGYRRSIEIMRAVDAPDQRLPFISWRNRHTEADVERFDALPVTTRWGRAQTIGEFRSMLRGRRATAEDIERQRTLFDYFHGEFLASGNPRLRHYAELGRRLRDYGVPVVAYWAPVPVERGETYFPGEFAAHVEGTLQAAKSAFEGEIGPQLHPVGSGPTHDDEIIDSRDGSEHWNLKGRMRMAALIADRLRVALGNSQTTLDDSERG